MALDGRPDVSTRTDEDRHYESLRELPRDLLAGLPRLRAKASVYLPRWPAEMPYLGEQPDGSLQEVDPWQARVASTRLTNKFAGICADVVGRVWSKPAEPSDDMPEPLREFLDDVDGDGRDINVFGLNVTMTAVCEGINYVLCEFPVNPYGPDQSTRPDEERLGLSPYWRVYPPCNVFRPKWRGRGSARRLVEVSLQEFEREADGAWGERSVDQIRVLRAGMDPAEADRLRLDGADRRRFASWEVYRKDENGDWMDAPVRRGTLYPQVDIPLVEFATDWTRPFRAAPPFVDVAWLNLAHFRKTSLLDNAQAAVGFPVLFLSGAPDPPPPSQGPERPVAAGARTIRTRTHSVARMVSTPKEGGDMKFVEPAGSTWAHLQVQLTEMEKAMDALGLTVMMSEPSGNLTATGEAIRSARGTTRIAAWARGWEDSFNRLLRFAAIYLRIVSPSDEEGWGSVTLNREYVPRVRSAEAAAERQYLHQAGILSDRGMFEEAQRAESIGEDRDFDVEQELVSKQAPKEPPPGEEEIARILAAAGGLGAAAAAPGGVAAEGDDDDEGGA